MHPVHGKVPPMRLLLRIGPAMLVLAAMVVLCPAAQAWQNGPSTRGLGHVTVQQWMLDRAVTEAQRAGHDWVDLGAALQTVGLPDTVARDFRYHKYSRWGGEHTGAAPERAAVYFALVRDALEAGDGTAASRALGMLTHYFTDACDPLHTARSRPERRMHRAFERRVMAELNRQGRFEQRLSAALDHAAVQAAGGPTADSRIADAGMDVAGFTEVAAKRAHRGYQRLVRRYLRSGFSPNVRRATSATIEHSVKGLAVS